MEVSAIRHLGAAGAHGRSPLLRLQSDERLVALVRRGNHHAFEALVSRYESRLLAFCRHMLSSREDAEDVLQEVFTAAFHAMLADDRPINVRPWLYRIARNRSLNHLRRVRPVGVDSMDTHFSEHGLSTADKAHRREDFRQLIADVQELPEMQRTALLLREIDALSYEQIAEAMDNTVPSVKSLLVRARVGLAEAAEARLLDCSAVRLELGEVAEGLKRMSPAVRRHVRGCEQCALFRKHLTDTSRQLAALLPVGPILILKKALLAQIGTSAAAAGGSAAAAGSAAGGALQLTISAAAGKAAAGLAAAAIVTAGAVEVKHVAIDRADRPQIVVATSASAPAPAAAPTAPPSPAPALPVVEPFAGGDLPVAPETAKAPAEGETEAPGAEPEEAETVVATPAENATVLPAAPLTPAPDGLSKPLGTPALTPSAPVLVVEGVVRPGGGALGTPETGVVTPTSGLMPSSPVVVPTQPVVEVLPTAPTIAQPAPAPEPTAPATEGVIRESGSEVPSGDASGPDTTVQYTPPPEPQVSEEPAPTPATEPEAEAPALAPTESEPIATDPDAEDPAVVAAAAGAA